jgi:hypothetical protein
VRREKSVLAATVVIDDVYEVFDFLVPTRTKPLHGVFAKVAELVGAYYHHNHGKQKP